MKCEQIDARRAPLIPATWPISNCRPLHEVSILRIYILLCLLYLDTKVGNDGKANSQEWGLWALIFAFSTDRGNSTGTLQAGGRIHASLLNTCNQHSIKSKQVVETENNNKNGWASGHLDIFGDQGPGSTYVTTFPSILSGACRDEYWLELQPNFLPKPPFMTLSYPVVALSNSWTSALHGGGRS